MTEDPATRSRIMRAVRSADTAPEMTVRRMVHAMGYRFRLHRKDLPGTPDLVLPRLRKVIFVHGCFWHAHSCVRGARLPRTNAEYWARKITRNARRDEVNLAALKQRSWSPLVVWECELSHPERVRRRLNRFLRQA